MNLPKVVMFIDDDAEDRALFSEAVGFINSTIKRQSCKNGFEALQLLEQQNAVIPDFIFLKIDMPLMNGRECFMALKKIAVLKHVPIIMCSASKYEGSQQECHALGADFYLVKPNTLIKMINSLLYVFTTYETKKQIKERAGTVIA